MSSFDYEFRVNGVVTASTLIEIEGIHVTAVIRSPTSSRAQTVMRGPVPDEAALHGIINRFYSIGLDIIEVRRLDGECN